MTTATRTTKQPPPQSAVAMTLRKGSLGVPSVGFFAIGAIGPLLVVAGVVPTFFAVTGLTSAPIFFLAVGLVPALFSAGYVSMARQSRHGVAKLLTKPTSASTPRMGKNFIRTAP